ncbi:MAG: ABC transporter substrate-binding protein [Chloroflexi bacterium]|nr:ABC transporter substrate-binding protein [Chloroflexota bacterium]
MRRSAIPAALFLLLASCGGTASVSTAPSSSPSTAASAASASPAPASTASQASASSGASSAASASASAGSASGSAAASASGSGSAAAKPSASGSAAASGAASAAPSIAVPSGGVAAAQTIAGATVQPLAQRAKVRLGISQNIDMLPLYYAIYKGYFDKAGIDIVPTLHLGSSIAILPQIARGDIDIMDSTASPGLSNAGLQGFDVKVISSLGIPKEGRLNDIWLMVLPNEVNQIKNISDLKGKIVEAGAEGTPIDLVVTEALKGAGLTPGKDVTVMYRVKATTDFIVIAQNKGADALGLTEPLATQAQKQNIAVKWKTYGFGDVVPWFKPSLMVANGSYIKQNPAILQKFLDVYLLACREVNAANGTWTDDILGTAVKFTQQDKQVLTDQGLVPYFDPNGAVPVESLQNAEKVWEDKGLVKQKVDVSTMYDLGPINAAVNDVGKAS